jgi:hypothetical protein
VTKKNPNPQGRMRDNLVTLVSRLKGIGISSSCADFRDFMRDGLGLGDFVYCDRVDERGARFALSNVVEHKGRANEFLSRWSSRYNVTALCADYSNSSYNTKHGGSREVLVTNYYG